MNLFHPTKEKLTNIAFLPKAINKEFEVTNQKIIKRIEIASRLLGELKSLGEIVPDVIFFIRMHVANESNASSKIEGTQTSIKEVLLSKEEISPEKRDGWEEVNNYIKTLNQSIDDFNHLPLSSRLIQNIHKQLLEGVQGKDKLPEEVKNSQNWIGGVFNQFSSFCSAPPSIYF